MDADEFRKLPREDRIARAREWWRDIHPKLVQRAIEAGVAPSIIEYHQAGGVAEFTFFEDIGATRNELEEAIARHFQKSPGYNNGPIFEVTFNRDALELIDPKPLSRQAFYGSCVDRETRKLIPSPGSYGLPEAGCAHGEFGYAFARPPYTVGLGLSRLQEIFDEVDKLIFPKPQGFEILDWAHPRLDEVSNYFEAGLEWWGAFLFTIAYPQDRRVTVISASSTD